MKTRTGKSASRPSPKKPSPVKRRFRRNRVESKDDDDDEDEEKLNSKIRVPHNTVNESVVIAAVIVDKEARKKYLSTIPSDGFYGNGHAEIWAALQELDTRNLEYDPATLKGIAGASVDIDYVEDLVEQRPKTPANLRHHVASLNWDRTRIELASGPLIDLIDGLKDRTCSPDQLRSLSKKVGAMLVGHGTEGRIRSNVEVSRSQNLKLSQRRKERAVFEFGIPALDYYADGPHKGEPRLLPGTAPGMVTVVTGLSGAGKSTTMANSLSGLHDNSRRVLVGAWEQTAGISLEMVAGIRLGMSRRDLTMGAYGDEEQREIQDEMDRLHHLSFLEVPTHKGKKWGANEQALDYIEQAVADSGCDVFVADLFRKALREMDPDDEEQALNRMQTMAQTYNCHFILVQQQRLKDVEQRADKRPTREGIKGSGAWVEVADNIIGWHRPAQWKDIADDHIEGLILKQRYGEWPLAVTISWEPEFGHLGEGESFVLKQEIGESDDDLAAFLSNGSSAK